MSKIRVAINGFGRIGRLTFRHMMNNPNIDLVAINDLSNASTLAHLLKYDSAQGTLKEDVKIIGGKIVVGGDAFEVYSEKDPSQLPWRENNIDVVLESTGVFRTKEKASLHLQAGAKKVVLSAPPKSEGIKIIVLGVNDDILDGTEDIVSNASCTTNCLAPMCKVLNENFGIEQGLLTTVHAYTADQRLQDAPHSDIRRARAAAISIVPTSTGAAKTVTKVMPELIGKLDGMALRVPVPTGSISDFTVLLKKEASKDEINQAFKKAAEGELNGILQVLEDELVSTDIIGSTFSSIFDPFLTYVQGNLVKINAWYDNEYGYSVRSAELIEKIAGK
jgi:glyceraldehyde 3-phosphate dehydrogenase